MTTRRRFVLGTASLLGAAGFVGCGAASRESPPPAPSPPPSPSASEAAAGAAEAMLITRAIPSSGERLPIVGLGSSATFREVADRDDEEALGVVLERMVALGGRVFDTAPSYGASEEVAGRAAAARGLSERLFWATKLNVAPRGGGAADPALARAQLEASIARSGKDSVDLVQIHNVGDLRTQLPILREAKEAGRIRYLGVTTTAADQYETLLELMRTEPLDFIGTNYAIDDRGAEESFLPLAQERGVAVLVYAPFGRTRLFGRVGERALPEWAGEFGATSWAQFFLKYVASHPAVTAITPATSRVANLEDNLAAAHGSLPDEATRRRMAEWVDALPG